MVVSSRLIVDQSVLVHDALALRTPGCSVNHDILSFGWIAIRHAIQNAIEWDIGVGATPSTAGDKPEGFSQCVRINQLDIRVLNRE